MSKKIPVISSSPRRGGNTDLLCDGFAAGAEGESGRRDLERAFASMDGFLDCIEAYEAGRNV